MIQIITKHSRKALLLIILMIFAINILLIMISLLYGNQDIRHQSLKTSAPPISINGNSELSSESTGGTGTYNDPYIIENTYIDGLGSDFCINISNTNRYFMIENCTLINQAPKASLKFNNVTNGIIIKTKINQGLVFISNSVNVTIAHNNIFNGSSIALSNMNNSIFYNNSVIKCEEVRMLDCYSNNMSLNNIINSTYAGLILSGSNNNTVQNNEIYDGDQYGIAIWDNSKDNNVNNNYVYNNKDGEFDIDTGLELQNVIEDNYIKYKEEPSNGDNFPPIDWRIILIYTIIIGGIAALVIGVPVYLHRRSVKEKKKYMLPED
ncbi:MAG: hypothetical protein GF317_02500 [Candidatus Lokiarchaeota archaeon]|nr:hypothetical protein [Candidatus Lokiarchaeota archaeon]MBD3198777.1 hypothetical protein [Candidatus Lokiarchaeota archaeon]